MNSSVDPTQPAPVAIIGMGCLFPKAEDLSRYWANIRDRLDAITEIPSTHWRPDDYFDADPKAPDRTYARRGGFLDPVDFPALDFGIAPANLEATDTTQLLGLLVAREALKDAGYGPGRTFDRDKVSVILGVTGTLELVIPLGARLGHPIWRRALKAAGVADATADEVVQGIADSYVAWQENSFPGLLGNVAAGRIANRLDLGGTNCVIDAACASSLGALHLAMLELASKRSDLVLTGGLDTFNDIFMHMCFSKTPALSPTGDARPFDAAGDGTILGEGLGVLALKRLDDAKRDGDRIYAVIRGVGSSSDGKVGAVYAPSAAGQMKALKRAYDQAGVTPDTIELLEAHGTGTKVGDAVELDALNQVYRAADAESTWCALGSVKSQIGHTKAAAGAAGLIKAALALHHKVLPATAKVTEPAAGAAPGTSPFYLNTESRPWMPRSNHPRRAAVSAFGFGGSNFHCVLEEAEPEKQVVDWDGDVQLLAFSAPDRDGLLEALRAWPRDLAWPALRVEAGRSRARFDRHAACRLVVVVERNTTDLAAKLDEARGVVERGAAHAGLNGRKHHHQNGDGAGNGNGKAGLRGPDGVFFETGPAAGGLAMLFPGQGAQHVGMLRGLACRFPQVHDALAEADGVGLGADGRRLVDLIYPHPAFTAPERERQESALRATEVAQPALGALSLGVFRLLEHFGVRPDAVAGHSYGELTALCAAGRIDAPAHAALSQRRGGLMARCGGSGSGSSSGGAMLAVAAPLDRVEAVVRDAKLDVVIANKNAPRQAVLSGPADEIARAARAFEALKISARPLAVSAAFHSRFVAEARAPFLETLRDVPFQAARVPVYANTTAAPYPDDPDAARALLAGQLAEPVEFVAQVEAMHRAGLRTFLEVGPDGKLTGLVRSILEGRDHAALAVDASRGERGHVYDLALALAQVAARGHAVDLSRWDDGVDLTPQGPRKPSLTVKVSGANFPPSAPARPKAKPQPPVQVQTPVQPQPRPAAHAPAATARPSTDAARISAAPTPTPTTTTRIVQPTAPVSPSSRSSHGGTAAPHGRNGTHTDHPMNPTNGTHSSGHGHEHGHSHVPAPAAAQPSPSLRSNDPAMLAQALRHAQDNLLALQKLSEQTSTLHRQFLDGQDKAQRSFQTLLEQQQRLTYASLGFIELPPTPSAYAPTPRTELPRLRETPPLEQPAPRFQPAPTPPQPPQAKQQAPAPSAPRQAPAPAPVQATPAARVAAPKPAPAPTPAPAPVAAAPQRDRIQKVLLAVVAEKTGYPAEMLEPDMLLDADLGIDSIKRVEILAAIQEQLPDAPVVKPEHLGTLRTLGQIVDFLGQGNGADRREAAPAPVAAVPATSVSTDRIQKVLLAVVAEKTGYPAEMLEPDMLLDADLGIDSIKRVEILAAIQEQLPDAPVVKPEHLGTLRTLGQIVDFLAAPGAAPAATATAAVEAGPTASQVQTVLMTVVAEKTGYPAEMLEPDMLLDADLGIDSIKRVEILAAIQEQLPDAPVVKPEHLGTLRTLGQIVDFLAAPGAAPAATATAAVEAGPTASQVQTVLMTVVAEKTGYPAEMLEPDMLLDADLGIDSIKRVEILAAIQEQLPDAPVVKPEHLGTLRTLGQIVDFLAAPNDAPVATVAAAPASGKTAPATEAGEPGRGAAVQRLVVTSGPLDAGVNGVKPTIRAGGEVWIAGAQPALAAALAHRLLGQGYQPRLVDRAEIGTAPPAQLDGLVLLGAPADADADEQGASIKEAFHLLRSCAPSLRRAGQVGGAMFATVSQLDGAFGFRGLTSASNPTAGGLAGLAKTAGHEWPEVACKAVDLDPAVALASPEQAASRLLDELFRPGPAEVGLGADGARTGLHLVAKDLSNAHPQAKGAPVLAPGDVVVITGGARGVTAEAAAALAETLRPTIVLLGRSPEPVAEPDWLAPLADEAEIKRALVARANGHATPQVIGAQFRDLTANREILATLQRIETAGSKVVYRSVDVRDGAAVAALLAEVRRELGPIRGVIHGAGVLADRRIEDQSDEQFAAVFDTKVAGLRALLDATAQDELRMLALFSSSTARFGRLGQVAYAAANEILNKQAQREAVRRPDCRVVAVNWGPWAGGMVTPSLRPLFESEGIPLIPLQAGARFLVDEIQSQADERPVEIVVLGPSGEPTPTPTPGGDGPTARATSPDATATAATPASELGAAPIFERTLDLTTTPILGAHVIDGRPVLPLALILEWLAQGALQRNPGLVFAGIDDLRLYKGVVLHDDRPVTIRVYAGKAVRAGASYRVPVEIRSTAGAGGRELPHARGEVELAERYVPSEPQLEERSLPSLAAGVADLYRDVLFHGPDLQGLERVEGCDESAITAWSSAAPAPSAWLDRPLRQAWVTDPLAVDSAFQMLIVWSVERSGVGSLPTFVGRYRQFRRAFPADGVRILARITDAGPHRARADLEFLDSDGGLVARMSDYECVIDSSLNQAFRRNQTTPIG